MHLPGTSLRNIATVASSASKPRSYCPPSADDEPVGRSNAARGVLTGMILGAVSWVAICALIWRLSL